MITDPILSKMVDNMKIHRRPLLLSLLALIILCLAFPFQGLAGKKKKNKKQQNAKTQSEEAEDYFKKWLNEDAVYIISEEEKDVFGSLSTLDEKEQFIEQFWRRRDPDLRSAGNEFKEEHYRRIAYVNERFHSGKPGWKSDRGRIYIIHGEPAEIEAYPSGGFYDRPFDEGGGQTSVYPFERWRYRHVDGVGDDIMLEFVDDSFTGDYHLALNPEEKDALLHMPGMGLTWAEQAGISNKEDRPYFNPGRHNPAHLGYKNNPFYRYEIFSGMQAPQKVKYNDLKELVKVSIGYENLPFQVRSDYFKITDQKVLVPITLQLQNKDMMFERDGDVHSARIGLYGAVTSLGNRFVEEFDHDLVVSFTPEKLEKGLQGSSMYQKILLLDSKTRYKLDLIVKDLGSSNIGAVKQAIIPPASVKQSEKLSNSSLILSDFIQLLSGELPKYDEMFVLGDVWIRPSVAKSFSKKLPLGVYLHVYNFDVDQSSNSPELEVKYRIRRAGQVVQEATDSSGESIQSVSGKRMVLIKKLDLTDLEPGQYRIEVEAWDQLSDAKAQVEDNFRVKGD